MGDSEFEFLWKLPGETNNRYCDACGRDIRGFLYHDHYSRHEFDLHPCCMNLDRDTVPDTHGTVKLSLEDKMPRQCVKCKRKDLNDVESKKAFRGWSYGSSRGDYCFHVYCTRTLVLEKWKESYFNVGSSSSSSSGSSLKGTSLVIRSGRRSNTSSALVRRSSRPKFVTRMTIKGVKLAQSCIIIDIRKSNSIVCCSR
ncbi:uncharacterized protein LOC129295115 [Prosopis cineraria]|uniref:uncharacterized protein LOC129295115 n=1 Tax=Prosopis cineraria TaxID=364024 RepID=UPI00241015FC|nr:uncharacterized protein LOC129295115 [Prosopis cineraria]